MSHNSPASGQPAPAKQTQWLRGSLALHVQRAAGILRAGGLVAMPTETVYGLAANALDPIAIESIFVAKQRPHWDPLIVHITAPKLDKSTMLLRTVAAVSPQSNRLMEAFWPGPLTLLLPRHPKLPLAVTAGRGLVGVRAPAHPIAHALIAEADLPLAAPSANLFGHISPSTAQHVLDDLDGRIDAVLDGGPCTIGLESTVYNPEAHVLYRQGGVSQAQIEACIGHPVTVYEPSPEDATQHTSRQSLPAPGVGIRHYAPTARLILVDDQPAFLGALTLADPSRTAVILPLDWPDPGYSKKAVLWAPWRDTSALAARLYSALREADAVGISTILCPCPSHHDGPLADAIRDRLLKAARPH